MGEKRSNEWGNDSYEVPESNEEIEDLKSKALYRVTKSGKTGGTVEYVQSLVENPKKVIVPDVIEVDRIVYKVTSVSDYAFKNCKKLKTVKLGKNIKTIGKKAFYKCTKLTKITIPSNVSKIKKQAFAGIHSKAIIKVPKKKLTSYAKMLKSKGIARTVKIK